MVNTRKCVICGYMRSANNCEKSLHRISRERIEQCPLIGINPNILRRKYIFICKDHFTESCFSKKRNRNRLHSNVIPTINLIPSGSNVLQMSGGRQIVGSKETHNASQKSVEQRIVGSEFGDIIRQYREQEQCDGNIPSHSEAAQNHLNRLSQSNWSHIVDDNSSFLMDQLHKKIKALEMENELLRRQLQAQERACENFSPDASEPAKLFARMICKANAQDEYAEAEKNMCRKLYMHSQKSYEFMRVHLELNLPEVSFLHNSPPMKPFVDEISDG